MKHRHKARQQHRSAAYADHHADDTEEEELEAGATLAKKKKKPHLGVEGARARYHLGKRGRVGLKLKRFADGGAASPGAPLSLDPADYSNVGMNGQGQWVNANTGKLLDQPPPLSPSAIAYMRQAARNPDTRAYVNQVNSLSELIGVLDGADATSIPGGLAPRRSGGRTNKHRTAGGSSSSRRGDRISQVKSR